MSSPLTPECLAVQDASPLLPLPPELEKHVAGCRGCQAMRALGPAGEPALPPLPDARALLARSRPPGLSDRHPAWVVGTAAALMLLPHLVVYGFSAPNPASRPVVLGGAGVLLTLLALAVGLGLGRTRSWLRAGLLAACAVVGAWLVFAGVEGPSERGFWEAALRCSSYLLALGTVPFIAGLWAVRGVAFRWSRALLLGLAAGLAPLTSLHLHCIEGTAGHLMLAHLLPWLGLGALLAYLASRLPERSFVP